jgi:signal transduction histidine kinase
MVIPGRRKSVAFISLGAGLILVTILLYVGWIVLDWQKGILIFFGIVMLAMIISGVVLNTIFLVREIRRNEQHNAFINAVTHELKTPVASIRLYLETLLSRSVDEDTRAGFYRTMLADSDRLLGTIEQVLRTGRVGPSSRLLHSAPVNLNVLLEECAARARALHHLAPDALEYEPGSDVTIMGDEDELRAALSNLIENAIKYSGKDIKIVTGIRPLNGRYVAVSIRDRGIGIPKSELKRIFRRFYRVPGAATARLSGTGLGLFIVRSVAKRHGGRAWAASEGPGHGSTFVLELPTAR